VHQTGTGVGDDDVVELRQHGTDLFVLSHRDRAMASSFKSAALTARPSWVPSN